MVKIIEQDGDILKVPGFIVHQVYCSVNNNRAAGLAEKIRKSLHANDYDRKIPASPGTIRVDGRVIHLRAQYYPGYPRVSDSLKKRLEWFKACLDNLLEWTRTQEPSRINFPYNIGCGLAGGEWKKYLKIIQEFSEKIQELWEVYIIKLNV